MFYAIRHGRTLWNEEQRIMGRKNIALSPTGVLDILSLIPQLSRLPLEHIMCSPLRRARESADIIQEILRLPLTTEPLLQELDYGTETGTKKIALKDINYRALNYQHPEGESLEQLYQRITAIPIPQNTLLVTHAGCIRALYARNQDEPFAQHTTIAVPHNKIWRFS
jgi:broad specificity phosphatase PhoE